ncbi:DUF6325 family protein [Kribbella endophytica]
MAKQDADHVLGPIDLLVVEIPPDGPGPQGFGALLQLAERDVVRILDLEVVRKSADGTLSFVIPGDGVLPELAPFAGASSGLLDADDLREAGAFIEPGRLGVVVIYENEWIVSMEAALREQGARLAAAGRIPAADLEAALGVDQGEPR